MAEGDDESRVTCDLGAATVEVPRAWLRVPDTAAGVVAWSSPDLVEHLIVGARHLPGPAAAGDRRALVDELVDLELAEIGRLGRGRVVVRRSDHDGDATALTIVSGVDATHGVVFAYTFVVSVSVALKLKFLRIGLDRSEREVLDRAAGFAGSLRLREIRHET